ncbi:MAG: hypothetical protein ABJE47_06710 [bacterium]
MLRPSLAALACLLLTTAPLRAQSSFSLDLNLSSGTGGGGDYVAREHLDGRRLAFAWRHIRSPSRAGFFVEGAADALAWSRKVNLVCVVGAHGTCLPPFPGFGGLSVVGGLLLLPASRVELRASVGGGRYVSEHDPAAALLGQVDGTVFPLAHWGLTIGTRYIAFPSFRGDALHERAITVGIRVR